MAIRTAPKNDPIARIQRAIQDALTPEPVLLVSEWADRHRILPAKGSAEPGPWRTSRTPYLRAIMDALATGSPYHTVVFAKGSQIGASEAGNNWLSYAIHHAPAPMLLVQPTVEMVKRMSKQRIQPMIDATPVLSERIAPSRARDAGNTLFAKDFPGGMLVMTGANSATGLRSMPARYLFLDEVDAYPGDVEGEGDPVELAIARTSTFKRNRKIYLCSTPTITGISRIWAAFERTDQRYYHVPCPECGTKQVIKWERIVWDEGKPETASLACSDCGVLIHERHKAWMLEQGEWVATAPAHSTPGVIGFHLSSLYSPPGWYSWSDAAREFLAAKDFPERLKSFINTKLGECWEDREGETADAQTLAKRKQAWESIPSDVLVLTAGIDVQDNRLEATLVGWSCGQRAYVLNHNVLWGPPGEEQVWLDLDEWLREIHTTQDGRTLKLRAACIDSGGHHTQAAYDFCKVRHARKIWAIKGRQGSHPAWPPKQTKSRTHRGGRVFVIGVDTIKDSLRAAFAVKDPTLPRHIAFAEDLREDYFEQLCAERRVIKRNTRGGAERIWKRVSGVRNEALDCLVYAAAALEGLKQSGLKLQGAMMQTNDERTAAVAAITGRQTSTMVQLAENLQPDFPSHRNDPAPNPPPKSSALGSVNLTGWARGR
jgi:phage terminase large subunit GpA-like protein